ncbi:Putative zinc-finger [Amycolatopsis keratiniphila]|nr:Putative zinc-finger [Amycolatopsis keratiniphila]
MGLHSEMINSLTRDRHGLPPLVPGRPRGRPHSPGRPICQTVGVDEMSCAELVERITDYLEEALGPDDMARLNNHLMVCESCENYLAQIKASIRVSGSLPSEGLSKEAEAGLVDIYRKWLAERDNQ